MKSLNLLTALIASSLLVACGEATDDTDVSPDPEFGLETLDGKDDSFAIRPGSPEADAVVRYVNQPLADNAAGDAFRDEIDSRLYRTAARNIAAFRAGDDKTFGTADDQLFEDITEVDAVRYVGRTSLMQLFELAEDAGYFQRASVDCADYVDHDRYDNYTIDSYADLLEFENARCTTINGNLRIRITGTDLLPPSARSIRHLRHLKTINGSLQITTSNIFNSIHFESLETVTDGIDAQSPVGRKHTLEFSALESTESIKLVAIEEALFPALLHNDRIELDDSDLDGFTALKTAGRITINQRPHGTFNIGFPELETVETLNLQAPRQSRYTPSDVTFTGGFDALTNAQSLMMRDGKYGELAFPRLHTVGSLNTTNAVDPYAGMRALTTVGSLRSTQDDFETSIHAGPIALQTVGSIVINTELPVIGYNKLETAEGSISITTHLDVQGFESLSTMGGSVSLNLGRSRSQVELSGFGELTHINSISISANNAPVTVGTLFPKLENTDGSISFVANGSFDDNPVFESLIGMGGNLRVDVLHEGADMMPALEIVDGHVTINRTPRELVGFPNLEHVEGNLTLKRYVNTISGLQNFTSLGGNLSISRTLDSAELDAFLNQLTEFSGTINYN